MSFRNHTIFPKSNLHPLGVRDTKLQIERKKVRVRVCMYVESRLTTGMMRKKLKL